MATASLSASARTGTGKGVARSLRRDGRVPAVIYGHGTGGEDEDQPGNHFVVVHAAPFRKRRATS